MTERRFKPAKPLCVTAVSVILPLAGIALAAAGRQDVGITSAVVNDVRISPANTPRPHRAALRERIALADNVQTGRRSELQVLLLDKSVFTVGANARLTIDRFIYDPAGNHALAAAIAKGAFRFMSGRPDHEGESSINTPIATIGIRGTIVDGVVGDDAIGIAKFETAIDPGVKSDPQTASLIVLRGPGQQAQGNTVAGAISVTAGGKTVLLDRPMLAAYVPAPGMVPIGPFFISRGGLYRINSMLFPLVAERRVARNRANKSPFSFRMGLPLPIFGGGQDSEPQSPRKGR